MGRRTRHTSGMTTFGLRAFAVTGLDRTGTLVNTVHYSSRERGCAHRCPRGAHAGTGITDHRIAH